jgi:gliding motility-associated protein GldM
MAGGKETPRQKMIGMMYLVLTALLALQVSSEIINKFDLINKSLEGASTDARAANDLRIAGIQKAVNEDPSQKNKNLLDKAQTVKAKTAEMIAYIDGVKKEMVEQSGGIKEDGTYANPSAETEMESLMVGPNKNGKGYEVKERLNKFAAELSQLSGTQIPPLALDAKDITALAKDPAQRNKDFAELNFAQTPMVAGLAVLSQKQNEISRYESAILAKIAEDVNAVAVKLDKIVAMVRPEAKVVAAGTKYKAEMFLAASSSSITPTMSYNGQNIPVTNGMGMVEFVAQGGNYDKDGNLKKTWTGQITIPKQGGGDTTFNHTEEYIVAKPVIQIQSASVQALYINCGNELKVSVPALGATYSPVFSGSGASFIQGANKGDVTVVPTSINDVTLNVSSNGNMIGSEKFKVRPVPRPTVAAFANAKEIDLKLGAAAPYPNRIELRALAEEGFRSFLPKDAQFRVSSFDVFLVKGKRASPAVASSGNVANIGSLISQAQPGDRLLIQVKSVQRMNFKGQIVDSAPAGSNYINIPLQ